MNARIRKMQKTDQLVMSVFKRPPATRPMIFIHFIKAVQQADFSGKILFVTRSVFMNEAIIIYRSLISL